jgi:polysaccharide export outer membrane protein
MNSRLIASVLLFFAQLAYSQSGPAAANATDAAHAPSSYLLGPNDQVSLFVGELEEQFADKTFRIDMNGDLTLPMIGRIHAMGLTQAELEDQVKYHFAEIIKEPDIVVNVTDYGGQPVSVLGSVNGPAIRQLQGGKSLFEVLALAGGLTTEAGTTVVITRDLKWGPIPLPEATVTPDGEHSVVTIRVKDVMRGGKENIAIRSGDTVFVPRADVVYAVGDVTKPGGFPIGENEIISALQVVSLAEGMVKTAAGDKAKILRLNPGSSVRTEIPINLKLLMAGKAPDVMLKPNDILFVPNSDAKSAAFRTVDAIVNAASGLALYSTKF